MTTNGPNTNEDAEMAENDGEKVVTMMDVLKEQQDFEEDANAVLGASDDKNCTYVKGYIKRQALYACMTCCLDAKTDPTKRAGVCLACSLNCHENHDLIELYTKRNFRCDCGNSKFNSHPCQYNPNKNDLNEENKYNQNYSGLYCVCNRPYPDPQSKVEDEMIQCIICEDWLHASHLEAVIPANDQYSEMICKGCMEKNEFLHDYSSLAVTAENGDVDVVMTNGETEDCTESPNNIKEQNYTPEDKPDMVLNGEKIENENDKTETNDLNGKTEVDTDVGNKEQNEDSKEIDSEIDNTVSHSKIDSETDKEPVKETTANFDVEMEEQLEETKSETTDKNIEETEKPDTSSSDTVEESQAKEIINESHNVNESTITQEINMPDSTITIPEIIDNRPDSSISDTESENKENSQIAQDSSLKETKDALTTNQSAPVSEESIEGVEDKATEDYSASHTNSVETMVHAAEEEITEKMEEDLLNEETDTVSSTDEHVGDTLTNDSNTEKLNENMIVEDRAEKSEDSELPVEQSESVEKTVDSTVGNKTENIIDTVSTKTELQDTGPENQISISEPKENINSTERNKLEINVNNKDLSIDNDNKNEPDKTENITMNNETDGAEKKDEDIVSETESKDHSDKENEVEDETEPLSNSSDNKRKLSVEDPKDDVVAKKVKLDEIKTCVRPKGVKRQFKGATFWPSNFRQKLCTCNECLSMYKDLSVLFLIDPEDTATAYEMLGKEKTEGSPSSQYEKGLQALSSLDRIQQINALTEYNKLRDKLLDFLKSFKDRKEIVKEEDIRAFFAKMKPKREPDGVYFCR